MNTALGRKVLDHVTAHREFLEMSAWATVDACGTSACIGGWALVLSGWEIVGDDAFRRLSDGHEMEHSCDIADEARKLLDLDDSEFWRYDPDDCASVCLFAADNEAAVRWLGELVEDAEADRG